MRFATASASGKPDVAPVIFSVDGDDVVTAGSDVTHTVHYRNVVANPRATVVLDDLDPIGPWSPRGIKIMGSVRIEGNAGAPHFRIHPHVVISWGINDTTPGNFTMDRRTVQE